VGSWATTEPITRPAIELADSKPTIHVVMRFMLSSS
jgi:hypothetical protein